MADSWEDVDSWEDQDFDLKPVQPAAEGTSTGPTAGQALLAQNSEPDDSKFADEKGIEDVDTWKTAVPPPKEKKKKETKKWEDEETTTDEPLDDPLAEKLRQQRLQEEGDLKAAFELFGTEGAKPLDQMVPKTETDFISYADVMMAHYTKPHKNSRHYKAFVKHICRTLLEPLNAQEAKEVESCVSQVRNAKVKESQAAQAMTKKGKKAQVNVGKGSVTAGLDDMVYDDFDDDGDFM